MQNQSVVILGLGGSGIKIITPIKTAIDSNPYATDISYYHIDTNPSSVPGIKNMLVGKGGGAGGNRAKTNELSKPVLEEYINTIKAENPGATIIICGGISGGTSSMLMVSVTKLLEGHSKVLFPAADVPGNGGNAENTYSCITKLEELAEDEAIICKLYVNNISTAATTEAMVTDINSLLAFWTVSDEIDAADMNITFAPSNDHLLDIESGLMALHIGAYIPDASLELARVINLTGDAVLGADNIKARIQKPDVTTQDVRKHFNNADVIYLGLEQDGIEEYITELDMQIEELKVKKSKRPKRRESRGGDLV